MALLIPLDDFVEGCSATSQRREINIDALGVLDISVAFALDRLRGCTASDHLIKQLADKSKCITNIVVLAGRETQ